MVSKVVLIAAMIAYVEARFGQEQGPIAAISAVQGGNPGAAATIAGATISDLLGAANACAKVSIPYIHHLGRELTHNSSAVPMTSSLSLVEVPMPLLPPLALLLLRRTPTRSPMATLRTSAVTQLSLPLLNFVVSLPSSTLRLMLTVPLLRSVNRLRVPLLTLMA
jgi:hypothetical protein